MEESQENIVLDFNTSSSIDRINLSFLIFYFFIFWMGGLLTIQTLLGILAYVNIYLYDYVSDCGRNNNN